MGVWHSLGVTSAIPETATNSGSAHDMRQTAPTHRNRREVITTMRQTFVSNDVLSSLEEFAEVAPNKLTEEQVRAASEILEGIDITNDNADNHTRNAVLEARNKVKSYQIWKRTAQSMERRNRLEAYRRYMKALQDMAEGAELIGSAEPPQLEPYNIPAETPETLRMKDGRSLDFLLNTTLATVASDLKEAIADLESQRATLSTALAGNVKRKAIDVLDSMLATERADLERCKALSADIRSELEERRKEREAKEAVKDVDATLIELKRRIEALEGTG